ncbi:MAG: cytochrome c biogenesis protein CcsA [Bacteroidaceae bacterium]|nr:cytochrome c biogenesis protein CcsA [Bacteroidaceae bacterium]
MSWSIFPYFAIASILLWTIGAIASWLNKSRGAYGFTLGGIALFFVFIFGLWISQGHPPLQTMGDTRLWYSALLPVVGLIVFARRHYRWVLSFSTILATVFVCVNLFNPELHTHTLMPALQSPWFAPHVIVYMFSYALLSVATLMAVYQLLTSRTQPQRDREKLHLAIDDTVRSGLVFLTFGMLFGALWAKEAWGHYWSWDPKETWAAITWLAYLIYLHYRQMPRHLPFTALIGLLLCFGLLQMCWWGLNYLPSATASVHLY